MSMKRRIAIVGLDGVPIELLRLMIAQGYMPKLARWLESRPLRRISSTLPPISSVAWTTLYTGKNSGEHGIFGFYDIEASSGHGFFTNLQHVQVPAIWDLAGYEKRRSLIFNVPQTYPAKSIYGVMISGFVALDLEKAVQPRRVYEYLARRDYRVDPETRDAAHNTGGFIQDLFKTLKIRGKVLFHLINTEPWDFLIAVITETDRLHHFLWGAFEDPAHAYHEHFFLFYRELDSIVGPLLEQLGQSADIILLSDHGFGSLKKEFYLNRWLVEEGYLQLKHSGASYVEDIHSGSRAFALDPSRIYLREKGKFYQGNISPGKEYENLRDELINKLLLLREPETASAVIERVFKKEELFSGAHFDKAPDLVVKTAPGIDPKGAFNRETLFGNSGLTGMHTVDDAFMVLEGDWGSEYPTTIEEIGSLVASRILS